MRSRAVTCCANLQRSHKASEDRPVDLQKWQRRKQGTIKAVADLIKDIVQCIGANADGAWGISKKFALIRWSQEEKDFLISVVRP